MPETQGQGAILLKERLWHSCFPENFANFLRTTFYRTPPARNQELFRAGEVS